MTAGPRPHLAPLADGTRPLQRPPSFSVVIPAFQAERTVADALESILAQTCPARELIVCDDGSTDETAAAARAFGDRVVVLRNERNVGESAAKNRALAAATGDFVVTLDADDVYRPERLAALSDLARLRPDLDILTTDAVLEANGRVIRRCYGPDWTFEVDDQRAAILERNFVFGHAAVRRERLVQIGGFDESIRWTEDWDCWARLILDGARAGAVMEPLSVYRLHPASLSAQRPELVRGRITTLQKASRHPSLTQRELAIVTRAIAAQRRELASLEFRCALIERDPAARGLALSRARDQRFSATVRVKAIAAAIAPGLTGRLARRRASLTWTAPGGLQLPHEDGARQRRSANVRRVDLRFVAPELVDCASVQGDLDAWRDGLEAVGIEVVGPDGRAPQLVVADEVGGTAAGADVVIIESSRARRFLEIEGYRASHYIPRPTVEDPALVLAVDHPAAARYALAQATGSSRGWRRVRNAVAASAIGRVPLPVRRVTVGVRRQGPPAFIAAAQRFGVPERVGWFMKLGQGDELSRNVFVLFEPEASTPAWALKFVRVRGYEEPFERDQRGLEVAAGEPLAAAHAPQLLGRFDVGGLDASLETAAVGEPLKRLLESSASRARKLATIETIAEWIVELGARTLEAPDLLRPERQRLAQAVIPHWRRYGVGAELVESLPSIGAVLQHNDLGSWNIVVGEGSFTAVDWEAARRHGFPLWDLAYFLVDSLATLERVHSDDWGEFVTRLFGGEHAESPLLFGWIRRGAKAAAVPPHAVGMVVTLGWLHHGVSHLARAAALGATIAGEAGPAPRIERIAELWLTQPGLGPEWSRRRDG